jgi:capsular polysaccharide biosynthesis protein
MKIVESDGRITRAKNAYFEFDGRLAVFLTPGYDNWFHWLIQCLPRLKILADSRKEFDALHTSGLTPTMRESLRLTLDHLGLSGKKILDVPAGCSVCCRHVLAPDIPWLPRNGKSPPAWLIAFIRGLVKTDRLAGYENILISRKGFSRYEDSAELERLLSHAMTIVDTRDLTFREQANIFASARLIVAPHGSGLTNVIFASHGARVIEIAHKGYEINVFAKLCYAVGCFYTRSAALALLGDG